MQIVSELVYDADAARLEGNAASYSRISRVLVARHQAKKYENRQYEARKDMDGAEGPTRVRIPIASAASRSQAS